MEQEQKSPPNITRDFSLEKRIPQVPLPSQQHQRLIWWSRVVVWISPGPAWALICSGLAWLDYEHPAIIFVSAIVCAYGMGYCDAFLSPSVKKKDGVPVVKQALLHALMFSLLQVFIAPLVILALSMFLIFSYSNP